MLALGYSEYVTQGGDWGSMITRQQARLFPKSVKAAHVNFAAMKPSNLLWRPFYLLKFLTWPWSKQEKAGLSRAQAYEVSGNAYNKLNSERPRTAAYMMSDSPVAVLGYIWEKIRLWAADSDVSWSQDDVLDWISIYWFSKAGPGASVNIYHEAQQGLKAIGGSLWEYMPSPLGVTQFPKDICGMPSAALQTLGPVVFERWADKGGHFAAWEVPDELIRDLRAMFSSGGAAFGVVDGKSGYEGL
jgi:pimeloyl-ACP methyl ester carboxylesterase